MKPPRLTRIEPPAVTADPQPQWLTLRGTGFQPTPQVLVNGSRVGTVTLVRQDGLDWNGVLPSAGQVAVRVQNPDGRKSNELVLSITAPTPPPPVPPTGEYGPQVISRPVGAVDVQVSDNLQTLTDQYPAATTFWIKTGVHPVKQSTRPKRGNAYWGEYGAALDGAGWVPPNTTDQGIFRAHDEDIDGVTVGNLILRNAPRAVHTWGPQPSGWRITANDIYNCLEGVCPPSRTLVKDNYIHHCTRLPGDPVGLRGGAYLNGGNHQQGWYIEDVVFAHNEIAACGSEQKMLDAKRIIFRSNFVHDCAGQAIWSDGVGEGLLVEGNVLERNLDGVHYELGMDGVIRNNIIRGSRDRAIFLSTTGRTQIHDNLLEDNFRGVTLFINIASINQHWPWNPDLTENTVFHNTTKITGAPGVLAAVFSYADSPPADALAPYLTNAKRNIYRENRYSVPDLAAWVWYWAGSKNWPAWQALPQDQGSTVVIA